MQKLVNEKPRFILAPLIVVVINALPGGIIVGQHPPLTPRRHNIQNGIDDDALIPFSQMTPTSGRFGKILLKIFPLFITQWFGHFSQNKLYEFRKLFKNNRLYFYTQSHKSILWTLFDLKGLCKSIGYVTR